MLNIMARTAKQSLKGWELALQLCSGVQLTPEALQEEMDTLDRGIRLQAFHICKLEGDAGAISRRMLSCCNGQ